MSPRGVTLGEGAWGVFADSRLKVRLEQLITRHLVTRPARDAARRELLSHAYLNFSAWRSSEADHWRGRIQQCRRRLKALRTRLSAGEIKILGTEGMRGDPCLTAGRLEDRMVRLRDLSADWLLLSVDRHPLGSENVIVQYWLYSESRCELRLLKDREAEGVVVTFAKTGPVLVQRADGSWVNPDSALQDDFYRLLATHLGKRAVETFRQITQPQEPESFSVPASVAEQCKEIASIDIEAEENKGEAERRQLFEKRHGPITEGPGGIVFFPESKIRVGIIPTSEPRPSE